MEQISSLYDRLGSSDGIRRLVHRFYEIMCTHPEAQGIRRMHPEDISSSEEKLFMFLSGWTGGPQLFIEKFGHPMLRRRHLPFSIGERERDQWMMCMSLALSDLQIPEPLRGDLEKPLAKLADHMRNQG